MKRGIILAAAVVLSGWSMQSASAQPADERTAKQTGMDSVETVRPKGLYQLSNDLHGILKALQPLLSGRTPKQSAEEMFEYGEEAFNRADYAQARAWYLKAAGHGDDAAKEKIVEIDKLLAALSIETVFVEGGTFTMGCTGGWFHPCRSNAKPAHSVTLSDFHIGKYVITQGQWIAFMDGMSGNPSARPRGNWFPVENVSWEDAQEFIRRLNEFTGKQYRLPTEAEWEYAACGGAGSRGYRYSGSNQLQEVGWYKKNTSGKKHPAGQKSPNELGIYDMSGNVWEWCHDWYGPYPDAPQKEPAGALSGAYKVLRGGSFMHPASMCGIKYRNFHSPGFRDESTGFRVALTAF